MEKSGRSKVVKTEMQEHLNRYPVISTRMVAGRPLVHVYSEDSPGNGFETIPGDLEDVFFTYIKGYKEVVANA